MLLDLDQDAIATVRAALLRIREEDTPTLEDLMGVHEKRAGLCRALRQALAEAPCSEDPAPLSRLLELLERHDAEWAERYRRFGLGEARLLKSVPFRRQVQILGERQRHIGKEPGYSTTREGHPHGKDIDYLRAAYEFISGRAIGADQAHDVITAFRKLSLRAGFAGVVTLTVDEEAGITIIRGATKPE